MSANPAPRTTPIPPKKWSRAMVDIVRGYKPKVNGSEPAPPPQPALNLFGTFAHNPALTGAFFTFNDHLLSDNSLSLRRRELVILRAAYLRRCEYEWAQHVKIARENGVTDAEIARVAVGGGAPEWSDIDRALLNSVDESLEAGKIADDTWATLSKEFDEKQLMDLIFTIGCYAMLAVMMRSMEVELEPGLDPALPEGW